MSENRFHTILVIGNNTEKIIKKYSLTTEVEKYIKIKRGEAEKILIKHIRAIKMLLDNKQIKLSNNQKEYFKELYISLKEMDDFDYFLDITKGCTYDEETGDAYSIENPDAKFKMYYIGNKCPFATPFVNKEGENVYSAKVKDIDWDKLHMNKDKSLLLDKVWQLMVDGVKPSCDKDNELIENWKNHIDYFLNFEDKESYIKHNCSYWEYGVTDGKTFNEVDYTISDKEWVATFYDRFIKNLPPDTLLTICEVRKLED